MKLEVGKRYVIRNGEVTGPLRNTVTDFPFEDDNHSWTLDGKWNTDLEWSTRDIVSEYIESSTSDSVNEVEPEPQQPLRWVENCKPDKPGIWARKTNTANVNIWNYTQQEIDGGKLDYATRCYLGPIPEILPPKRKVVERLWLEPIKRTAQNAMEFEEAWFVDEETIQPHGDWIRTDRTREREI